MPGPGGPGGPGDTGNIAPVIETLDPLFTELADLLGQLAGNEAAWSILYHQAMEAPVGDGWIHASTSFTVPGTYGWTKDNALYIIMSADNPDMAGSDVTNEDRQRIVQEAVTKAWHDGHDSWTQGYVSSAYRNVSQNIWEPDPAAMSGPVTTLSYLTQWLNQQLQPDAGWVSPGSPNAPEWLTRLKTNWPNTSLVSESFYDFWDDVNDKCGLYLHAAARLSSTSGQVTATISDFQTNLLEVTKKARDQAKNALVQWQTWKMDSGYWPTGEMTDNSGDKAILSGISYGAGIVSLFPPAAPIAGPISVATGTWSYLLEEKTVEMEATQWATAGAISSGFVNDLTTMDTNMTQALDVIHTDPPNEHSTTDDSTTGNQGFRSYAATVVANRADWSPPSVDI